MREERGRRVEGNAYHCAQTFFQMPQNIPLLNVATTVHQNKQTNKQTSGSDSIQIELHVLTLVVQKG